MEPINFLPCTFVSGDAGKKAPMEVEGDMLVLELSPNLSITVKYLTVFCLDVSCQRNYSLMEHLVDFKLYLCSRLSYQSYLLLSNTWVCMSGVCCFYLDGQC